MQKPTVSVLIPAYNYAHYLDETIQSVLNQTYQDFELVISDNCSTDNTEEMLQKYLADPRITYHKNATNIGVVGNMNKCLEYATGKYIKMLCADDKFEPQLLEKFVDVMEKNPDVSLVVSYRQIFGNYNHKITLPLSGWHKGQEVINHTLNTYGWLGEPSATMIRTENLRLGFFRKDITWLIDAEMWMRQLTVGNCYIIPEPLVDIRMHATQVTVGVMKNFVNYFEEYQLVKDIQEHKGYNYDTSAINLDAVIKKRAAKCAKAMYMVLPRIYKKGQWSIFKKAFAIAKHEGVLLTPVKQGLQKVTGAK